MTRQIPPLPLTKRQLEYDENQRIRVEIWRENWLEGEKLQSQKMWAQYHQEGGAIALLHDAEVAAEEAKAVRAARDARLASTVAQAVSDTFLDLDP